MLHSITQYTMLRTSFSSASCLSKGILNQPLRHGHDPPVLAGQLHHVSDGVQTNRALLKLLHRARNLMSPNTYMCK